MRHLMRRQGSEGAFPRPFRLSVMCADQWCVRIKSDKLRSRGYSAAPIDVQIEPRHIASAWGVRDRSERGPPHSDFGPIQKGPSTARLPGDEAGLPGEAGRTRDTVWGDNPDALARHSLRQCLISLRQDLCLASEILLVDRETIGLRTQFVCVDARRFMSLARSAGSDGLAQAAELWQGTFLPDLALDIEAFDTWHRQEADRLSAVAADVFEALCRNADANGDGNRAIAAAERLVALEPTREDRQRTALVLFARYKGHEAALSRARQLTDLLRSELGVSPEAATRALIDAIKRGDFKPAHADNREEPAAQSVVKPISLPNPAAHSLPVRDEASSVPASNALTATQAFRNAVPATLPFWR